MESAPSADTVAWMQQYALLLVVAAATVGLWLVRRNTSSQRHDVMRRIEAERMEREERGEDSPVAALFREAGAPAPEPVMIGASVLPPPPPSPAAAVVAPATQADAPTVAPADGHSSTHDLHSLFVGLRLPEGVEVRGEVTGERAVFVADRPVEQVIAAFRDEFTRLGLSSDWHGPAAIVSDATTSASVVVHAEVTALRPAADAGPFELSGERATTAVVMTLT